MVYKYNSVHHVENLLVWQESRYQDLEHMIKKVDLIITMVGINHQQTKNGLKLKLTILQVQLIILLVDLLMVLNIKLEAVIETIYIKKTRKFPVLVLMIQK
jgi:hypothetical protein